MQYVVTGAAGFIGSNLVEALLKLDQRVVALDNFATGHRRNLDEVRTLVQPREEGCAARLELGDRSMMGELRNLRQSQPVASASFPYRLICRRMVSASTHASLRSSSGVPCRRLSAVIVTLYITPSQPGIPEMSTG